MRVDQVTFSFHNRLGLALEAADSQPVDFFRSELAFAEGELGAGLPFVRLGWMTSSEEKEVRAPLIPASHKILARWRYGINMDRSVAHLRVAGNSISIPIVFHSMVLPSLRLLVASTGEILLHGAAVVKTGQSIILTGKRGIGKTTVGTVLLDFGGEDWAQQWQSQELSRLMKLEASVPIHELTLPRKPDPQSLVQKQIAGLLNALVSNRA